MRLTVTPNATSEFAVCLRIPGWALNQPVPSDLYRFGEPKPPAVGLKINGQTADPTPRADGYVHLPRRWKAGDVVELDLPMPVQRVYAHEQVQYDHSKVALMRGPIVYCLEAVDNPGVDLARLDLPRDSELRAEYYAGLLGGLTVLEGKGAGDKQTPINLTAVPYFAWQNREKGAMKVWIQEASKP